MIHISYQITAMRSFAFKNILANFARFFNALSSIICQDMQQTRMSTIYMPSLACCPYNFLLSSQIQLETPELFHFLLYFKNFWQNILRGINDVPLLRSDNTVDRMKFIFAIQFIQLQEGLNLLTCK